MTIMYFVVICTDMFIKVAIKNIGCGANGWLRYSHRCIFINWNVVIPGITVPAKYFVKNVIVLIAYIKCV